MFKPLHVAVALVLTALSPGTLLAQWPRPRLSSLSRTGTAAGESVDVTLRGTDLEGVHALWFDHPGFRAFHRKGLSFCVACAPGTPPGHHDVRAIGPYGVSNPRTFVVGDRPESLEAEPNNAPSQANPLAIGSVVNGEIAATDVDCFVFEGRKGLRVFLDLAAERIESRLDATLRVLDASGRELAECRDDQGADPFLDLTLPADGRYVVKVHDVIYGGTPDHPYRLTLSEGPHLDAIVPTIAAPGVAAPFTLIGRGIGGTPDPSLAIDGRPLERLAITLTPPPSDALAAPPAALGFLPSPAAPRRGFEYAFRSPRGTSNPLFVAEATDPITIENEPNDDGAHAQDVAVPCDISGRFGAPNDTDLFRFKGRKGDVWWIEATAERLGSPADPAFVVQRILEKGVPQDQAAGEDSPDPGGGARFLLASADASVRWQVPEDGVYQVAVNDLYGSQRGDVRLAYRLNIRPGRPDFGLVLLPESAGQVDAVTIGAGGRAQAYVLAWRSDGFAGPIEVEARDLPAGVRCASVTIASGQALAPIVFEAAQDASPVVGAARLVGRARFGDRKEQLRYVAGATPLGPDVEHEALAGGMTWPPANPQQPPVLAPARVTRGFVVAVGGPAPLALTASPASLTVAQGHALNLDLAATRRGGFDEAIEVTASGLPTNLANASAKIARSATTGTLSLFVARTVAPGVYTFVLRGGGPFPFSKDPNAKPKPNITLNEPSNPITLVVRPAPVHLSLNNKGGTLKAGGSLEVMVTAARQNGFAGGLSLSLVAPASLKLSAPPVAIGPAEGSARLVVTAAADSPAGASASSLVRAIAIVRGEPVEVDEPLPLTIGK